MPDFTVENMTCGHCVAAVTAVLRAADPDARVAADLATGRVVVVSGLPPATLAAALAVAGYPARAA